MSKSVDSPAVVGTEQAQKYDEEREKRVAPVWKGDGGLPGGRGDTTMPHLAGRFRHANRHRQAVRDLMM